MKALKILGHPYTVIISFLFLLISGEHLGGFYLLYILLALPHGAIHALLAVLGVLILLVKQNIRVHPVASVTLNAGGLILMVLSLYYFFSGDPSRYNSGTFKQAGPLITYALFGLIILCSIAREFVIMAEMKIADEKRRF